MKNLYNRKGKLKKEYRKLPILPIAGYLKYICPTCGKTFKAHVHGDVYERKQLFCSKDGSLMNCALEKTCQH